MVLECNINNECLLNNAPDAEYVHFIGRTYSEWENLENDGIESFKTCYCYFVYYYGPTPQPTTNILMTNTTESIVDVKSSSLYLYSFDNIKYVIAWMLFLILHHQSIRCRK